ncbi:restriction endonuclease subunit S [Microbulbifer sp. M83]|uniref:restriction endonuclease subunit S n=1 Tax=Microbulbifer sp. M83 TaxID=3118246 RepID=UPI002FDFF4A2
MVEQLITEHLDLWTSAHTTRSTTGRGSNNKLELTGIKKLRELILELAVRGKLVPQDPSDEPVEHLIERLATDQVRLISEKKIRKPKKLPQVSSEEQPFDLPNGWAFVRLADVAFPQAGFAFKSRSFNQSGSGFPIIRIRDVGQPFSGTFYDGEYREEFLVNEGDYLISMDGNFRVAPWKGKQALLNQRVSRLIFFSEDVNTSFVAEALQARLTELQGVKAYTTVDHLSGGQISASIIPLPPVEEQVRIVAKIDELMALCDQLEQQTEASISAHQTLVETLLTTLTDSADANELAENWARLAEHFDTLFTTEHSIAQLKQTILQLAVMGKLVLQNPEEEPGEDLAQRISEEKALLIQSGKIRKQKALATVSEEDIPFHTPPGWAWRRLDDIVDITSGITKGRKLAGRKVKALPYLRVANVQRGSLNLETMKDIEVPIDELEKFTVRNRDLLITEGGDWDKVGRTAIWNGELPEVIHQNHVFKARLILQEQSEHWLEKYLNSNPAREYFAGSSKQTTNLASINKTQLRGCIVPVPPLAEQYRILAKMEELLSICWQLESALNKATDTQLQFSSAIASQAVA